MADKSHAPSFPIARLFRKTSANGNDYFTGRLGGARVTLLKSHQLQTSKFRFEHLSGDQCLRSIARLFSVLFGLPPLKRIHSDRTYPEFRM